MVGTKNERSSAPDEEGAAIENDKETGKEGS